MTIELSGKEFAAISMALSVRIEECEQMIAKGGCDGWGLDYWKNSLEECILAKIALEKALEF